MENLSATVSPRRPSRAEGFSRSTTARSDIDPSCIDHEAILSPEEIQILYYRFASYNNHATRKSKSLSGAQAIKLFRDDYPGLSEWELQEMFRKCDLNFDGQLSIAEYLQARAYHRLAMEANTETEVYRSFTILDTDGDGIILADEVLALVEQSGLRTVGILKQAITQAAAATKQAEQQFHRHRQQHTATAARRHHDGEITFEHFTQTIRLVNRIMEQEIAVKSLRVMSLHGELARTNSLLGANLQPPQKRSKEKREALLIEIDVLQSEILRAKRELLTDTNNPLGRVCENLITTYENEQHVYECLSNFITYCSLRDTTLFRYKLEKSGKEVHVLDSVLLAPPPHIKKTEEYARMMDLSLSSPCSSKPANALNANARETLSSDLVVDNHQYLCATSPDTSNAEDDDDDLLLMNPTLRKQFVYYTTAANITNLETMTRSSFTKFVRDCEFDILSTPPLTEADLVNIFARACGTSKLMTFKQWISATRLIFQRAFPQQCTTGEDFEALMKRYVIPKAKTIQTQNLAPDVSLSHVMKLLKEHIWKFKQIFSHFGIQSLVEVDSKVMVDMKEFLCFTRAFGILRSSEERDGEPYTPPPMSENPAIKPISLMELVREFYAAKLDVSFSNIMRRDTADLNFREFIRCILRISLAMHAHNPKKPGKNQANGIVSTTFEALKEEEGRTTERPRPPLYHRRGNILGSSPTKICKMTSTSIISKLLRTSRAMISQREIRLAPNPQERTGLSINTNCDPWTNEFTRSPVRIVYSQKSPDKRKPTMLVGPESSQFCPARPMMPQKARPRPVTSGGPPVIRLIRPPDT